MCLYPRFIRNKKYFSYISKCPRRGEATASPCTDWRKLYVPIGCGKCYECKRQKAQQWRVRLCEEFKANKHSYFITLTFSNENFEQLCKELETTGDNAIATFAVRRFLERWRKKHKVSLRHWLITELGHENTERVHLHGIIFTEKEISINLLQTLWKYGKADIGEYCNERTINYIVKYVTKVDTDHKNYEPVILCSAGIGKAFTETYAAKEMYKYKKNETPEYYTLNNGQKVALPIYYRNKFYTQNERDKMWTERLDKAEIYVNGIRIRRTNTERGQLELTRVLKTQQEWNKKIGYGDTSNEWKTLEYNNTFKALQKLKKKGRSIR